MSYIEKNINSILKGDTIETLKCFPDSCIDVIFADPPYFMQTSGILQRADGTGIFNGCNDEWDKYKDYADYDQFTTQWLRECRRVLKPNGTIWVIGSFQNIYRIGYIMQNLGFWILNDVIWAKTNPTPNMAGTRFCNAHETLLWCAKSEKSKFTFNYKTMKHLNGGKQDKSVWTLGICQGKERLKDKFGKKLHTTQKPEALLEKVILSSTKPNDIILDPFFGTGTTGAVAKKLGRNFIGIERDEEYIFGASQRINDIEEETNEITNLSLEVKPPKVSLSQLIEAGLIAESEILYNLHNNKTAILLNNNKLLYDGELYSIHALSAMFLNKANHNGWSFFYIKRDGSLICIDELRYKYTKIKEQGT